MKNYALSLSLIALLSTIAAEAKDLGKYGATFTVKEESIVEFIVNKLKALEGSGELEKHNKQIQKQIVDNIKTPPGLNLPRALGDTFRLYDPTFTVEEDIKDNQGRLIHAKGTKINPLEHTDLGEQMFFIDAKDNLQLDWLKRQIAEKRIKEEDSIILTGGSPWELMRELNIQIYFDQNKALTKKFGLTHVPSVISQEGNRLKILEVKLES